MSRRMRIRQFLTKAASAAPGFLIGILLVCSLLLVNCSSESKLTQDAEVEEDPEETSEGDDPTVGSAVVDFSLISETYDSLNWKSTSPRE